jgi:hypothetical protein
MKAMDRLEPQVRAGTVRLVEEPLAGWREFAPRRR